MPCGATLISATGPDGSPQRHRPPLGTPNAGGENSQCRGHTWAIEFAGACCTRLGEEVRRRCISPLPT